VSGRSRRLASRRFAQILKTGQTVVVSQTLPATASSNELPRSPGPSVQDLLRADSRPVPKALLDHSTVDCGTAEIPKSRYTSVHFAALENEYLWRSTWQMACHLDDLPTPGSHVVYDVANESVIVTRTTSGRIAAYFNSCLHRGTKLRTEDGNAPAFRCPFHGWTWNIDGELIDLPAKWDFAHFTESATPTCLPEAQVAQWGGFVFVNLDPSAEPFESYASKLIEHFADFRLEDRYIAFHAVKEVPANWKVVMEAFAEAYHVIATHPQILEFCADENSDYSVWPDSPNTTRFYNAFGVGSPHMGALGEQAIADAYLGFYAGRRNLSGSESQISLADGQRARPVVAEMFRGVVGGMYGVDLSQTSDAEMLDAVLYHLFPAFAPWAGVGQPLVYRWRPGSTPDTCFMDVIRMQPVPTGSPRPPRAPMTVLSLEQSWKEAPGMGALADVFEQDMANIPRVQAGLKSAAKSTVTFSRYQEGRMRHIHRLIDASIEQGLRRDGKNTEALVPFIVSSE
jgi:phenylpropionate dioxygenase-like ring-hydroxylating dioxygenase large terminal subunit